MGLYFNLLLRYLYTINCPDVVKIVRDTFSKKLWPVFYAIIWTTTQSDCVCIFSYTKLFSLTTKFDWKTQNSDYLLETKLANRGATTEIWVGVKNLLGQAVV